MTFNSLYVWSLVIFISNVTSRHHHFHHHQDMHPASDEFIQYINSHQNSWTAGQNFHNSIPMSYLKTLTGTIVDASKSYEIFMDAPPEYDDVGLTALKKEFDARTHWSYCESISSVRDQGSCSSCWAVAVASAMTDRLCIFTSGIEEDYFSEEDIISCCPDCSQFKAVCNGGYTEKAWAFTRRTGVVSGGVYKSRGGCKAYEVKPCNHKSNVHDSSGKPREECTSTTKFQTCKKECTTNPKIVYSKDKKSFALIYSLPYDKNAVAPLPMMEIFRYGPITATFSVYKDFFNYKSGVYRRFETWSNTFVGNHTVKILGWGVEGDTKYWLGANSWNSDWGDNGFFKIVRGENHCNIEEFMMAGKP